MKVCWFGLYKSNYSRNKIFIDGLRMSGVDVLECNTSYKDKNKYFKLIKKLLSVRGQYDILYCAFPINYNVIFAKILQRKPIVIDAFFPLYDAYVFDRRSVSRFSIKAFFYKHIDRWNLCLADLVIADTQEHKSYWLTIYPKANVVVVPVGADDATFFPIKHRSQNSNVFSVVFQGTYIPLQGIEKIVEAAEILKNERAIQFTFIGQGQTYSEIRKLVAAKNLPITFLPYMPIQQLNIEVNKADLLLGIFGDSKKTDRVVPNKVFQALAVEKSVITKDTPAIRSLFTKGELTVVDNTPQSIAAAIRHQYVDKQRRNELARAGHLAYKKKYTTKKIGALLKQVLTSSTLAD